MPLTHIQLRARRKEEPALGRALRKEKPKKVFGPTYVPREIKPYAGPVSAWAKEPAFKGGMEYTPVTREPLARALGAPTPAPDIQAEAWARRKEIVAEEQARLDTEADALYSAVQDLSPKDQNFILSKVVGKGKSSLESALSVAMSPEERALMHEELRERDPTWDPTEPIGPQRVAIKGRTDPLMQTLIDKHYIRLDENGQTYSWMLPEPEKTFVEMITDPQTGELMKLYTDGSTERTYMFEDITPEVEAPTYAEQTTRARLQFDVEKYGQGNVVEAMKQLGNAPIEGVTTLRKKGTDNYRTATPADVEAYYTALEDLSQYIKVQKGGPQTMEDMEALYRNRPDLIKNVQQQLGMIPDGVWSTELGDKLYEIFTREE